MKRFPLLLMAMGLMVLAALPAAAGWEVFLPGGQYDVEMMRVSDTGVWMLTGEVMDSFVRSLDHGTTWQTTLSDYDISDICVLSGHTVLLACDSQGMLRSTNDGATWSQPDSLPQESFQCYTLGRNPVTGTLVAQVNVLDTSGETCLYRSLDAGATWHPVLPAAFPDAQLTIIRGTSEGTLFLASHDLGLQRSLDDGLTWEPVVNLDTDYYCLAEAPDGTLFLGTETLYRSDDGGATWVLSNDGLTPWKARIGVAFVKAVAFGPGANEMFLTYAMVGVFHSTDGGHTWAHCDDTLPNAYDATDVIADDHGVIHVSITADGIFRWIPEGTPAPAAAGRVRLLPAMPNPCNPRTLLRFTLPRAMPVTLDLLDAAGRRVRRLWDGLRPAGPQSLECDGNGLASGVYLSRLAGPGWSRTGRFTLVR